jgi:hypothetical protein
MSEATEMLEHMEHAGHSGHGKGPGRQIGITMALLGVMLAFCAAMVGSERTELIKTMVEQANRWGIYQSETTKLRVIEGDLEILKALTPSKAESDKLDETLRSKRAPSGKADDEDTAEIKDLIASSLDDMTDLLAPDPEDVTHFKKMQHEYKQDVADAKEDAEAYEGAIHSHESAAEWYERAQLAAEIGIVIASVALLLSSRGIWAIAVICGLAGGGIIGYTAYTTHIGLAAAEKKIDDALKNEAKIEDADEDKTDESGGDAKKDEPPAAKEGAAAAASEKKPDPKAVDAKEPPKDAKAVPAAAKEAPKKK